MSTFPLDFNKPKKKAPKRALRFEIKLEQNGTKDGYMVDFPKLLQNMMQEKKSSEKGELGVSFFLRFHDNFAMF